MTLKEEQPSRENEKTTKGTVDDTTEEVFDLTDPFEQIEAELATAKTEIYEWRDRFMRKSAEFDNYRKRVDREKSEIRTLSQSAILRDLLPILDGFDRAMTFFGNGNAGSVGQWLEGIEMLRRQAFDTMTQAGVAPIEAEGKPFDPHLHEALSRMETSDVAEGVIVNEVRRGYMFRDNLLRPSQVIVAVQPVDSNPENQPGNSIYN